MEKAHDQAFVELSGRRSRLRLQGTRDEGRLRFCSRSGSCKGAGETEESPLYYETAADFSGIDPGAMWEDFKVGMEHLTRWERVAVVTDVEWIKQTMRFFGFLMPGAMKSFPTSEAAQARAWIIAAS